jgi:TolB protein
MDLATGSSTQLTQHWAIDTEATWAPDGNFIYFTSDRGGKPQIYKVSARGGTPERVTLEGEYNARASVSPKGRKIAVAHGRGNEYRIAVWDLDTERFTVLTPGTLDESPSFAPNGSMVLYATREGGRGVLSAVSADGNVRQRLVLSEGDVREPAWSPVIR